jgi:hypothetical protein
MAPKRIEPSGDSPGGAMTSLVRLVAARISAIKRSTPRRSERLPTGNLAANATNPLAVMPAAPFDVNRIASKVVNCSVTVRRMFMAWAKKQNADGHIDRSAVHVESKAGWHHQSDHFLVAIRPFEFSMLRGIMVSGEMAANTNKISSLK